MILTTDRIRALMHDPLVAPEERLIITPILDWQRQAKRGQGAVDLRLGQRFSIPRRTKLAELDHVDKNHEVNIERYKDVHHVLMGDFFVLHPRQFVLGETLEWVHLPNACAAYVIGRSSWGRDGLIIATATGVHPAYSGVLTLEITNVGEIPIRLYPGLTIAQLFIHSVDGVPGTVPEPSSFAGSTSPESGNAAGDDSEVIRRLAKERGFDTRLGSAD